ncbi:MAG: sulfurtransferase TusA family protein [Deltaproteobacteria bacterium]|jgi:TusA-related sulfurtransferase|nr:sulfurtransferase TusA family protein [Deltaproteobacteria bacterium]
MTDDRANAVPRPEAEIDVTDALCPLTFVRSLAALDELEDGRILKIRLNDGEAARNVPLSLRDEGHQLLKLTDNGDGTCTLLVRKLENGA